MNEPNVKGGAIEKIRTPEEEQKRFRELITENIVVTVGGHDFNGNERSQERIRRALDFAEATGQTSVSWVLADGSIADVPVGDLKTAYLRAMEVQYTVYVKAQAGQLTREDVRAVNAELARASGV